MNLNERTVLGLVFFIVAGASACSPSCVLTPTQPFEQEALAEPLDYEQPEAWAARPDHDDKADMVPPSVDPSDDPRADVFFVHPTTWIDRKIWNDPLDSKKSREMIEEIILPGQASVFNGCCRIFAPLYRQATLGAYFAEVEEATPAFSVAYQDLERAFEVFVDEIDDHRPFIVAAHSQGSMHAMRLLERIDSDPALRQRLVAAYIPGFAHPMDRFGRIYEHLEPCETPDQTGCIASWDTYREGTTPDGADPLLYWEGETLVEVDVETDRQCTNPVTWRADEQPAEVDAHRGAVPRINEGKSASFWRMLLMSGAVGLDITGLAQPRTELLSARCKDGVLRIPDLDDLDYEATETSSGNYHLVDYELFYLDIRHNAEIRLDAWLKARENPPATHD